MKTILFSNSHLNNSSDCPDFIIDKLNRVSDIVKRMMRWDKKDFMHQGFG
jgi:hypothetical protein